MLERYDVTEPTRMDRRILGPNLDQVCVGLDSASAQLTWRSLPPVAHNHSSPSKTLAQILSGSSGSGSDGSRRQCHHCAYRRPRAKKATQGEEAGEELDAATAENRVGEARWMREAVKNRQNAARLEEERRQETERFLTAQALANNEELAGKAVVRTVMMMKQEALNIAFGGASSLPPPHSVGGVLSTSSVTSTPSRRPPLEARAQHSCRRCSCTGRPRSDWRRALPVWRPLPDIVGVDRAYHRPQPDTIDKGHHPEGPKKPRRISTADMSRAVNMFDKMPSRLGRPPRR
jgi:hypothetical protein